MLEFTDLQKAGLGFLSFGVAFLFLSVMLFFDGGLMALANIFLLLGLMLVVGVQRSVTYFLERSRAKATGALLLGMAVVLYGSPMIGIVFEVYGLVVILRGLFPGVLATIRSMWSTWFFP
ncbi:vesicle transport protein GOT1B-like [Tropilaelaps mercedesae]|uniref:Vesicle transport protein GOT1B-like n=1 Tax=Tropilaelaps mercedesae TaxID=418985 RepID=A0A1V9Y0N2_9ACAR|nr:vesicle transport protein GOT1B-like [Tropilaelaps mercedesae]